MNQNKLSEINELNEPNFEIRLIVLLGLGLNTAV